MDWTAFFGNLLSRVPIEKFIVPQRNQAKALQDFAASVRPPESPNKPTSNPGETSTIIRKTPAKVSLKERPGEVTQEQTVDYQNRETGKLLLRMERHYAQRLRINGIPCDCGSQKHLLDLESLCEETIPMVSNPQVYYNIVEWIKKVGPTSTDEAAKSGLYDEEYPNFSHEARDFRKEILGTLDPHALFPQKPGEPEGTRILPVISEGEKEQIREKAHQKIEEVLGQ